MYVVLWYGNGHNPIHRYFVLGIDIGEVLIQEGAGPRHWNMQPNFANIISGNYKYMVVRIMKFEQNSPALDAGR